MVGTNKNKRSSRSKRPSGGARRRSNARNGNYNINQKTLGLELVASEELLAKYSNIAFDGDDDRDAGAQIQLPKATVSNSKMTMATSIHSLLMPPQELRSQKKFISDNSNECTAILLPGPTESLSPPPPANAATTIRRLEPNARDTPSIGAKAKARMNLIRAASIKKFILRNETDPEQTNDDDEEHIEVIDEDFTQHCTKEIFEHRKRQIFDSSLNVSDTEAASADAVPVATVNHRDVRLEKSEAPTHVLPRNNSSLPSLSSQPSNVQEKAHAAGATVNHRDVRLEESEAPTHVLPRNNSSLPSLSSQPSNVQEKAHAAPHSIESQQQSQPDIDSSHSSTFCCGVTLAALNDGICCCSPRVSSSEIPEPLRTDSFMQPDTSVRMISGDENQILQEASKDPSVLDSPTSLKRETSTALATGVEGLINSEHKDDNFNTNGVVNDGKDANDDDSTWSSLDTQDSANACNTPTACAPEENQIHPETEEVHQKEIANETFQEDADDTTMVSTVSYGEYTETLTLYTEDINDDDRFGCECNLIECADNCFGCFVDGIVNGCNAITTCCIKTPNDDDCSEPSDEDTVPGNSNRNGRRSLHRRRSKTRNSIRRCRSDEDSHNGEEHSHRSVSPDSKHDSYESKIIENPSFLDSIPKGTMKSSRADDDVVVDQ
jgi:hypothetical protein